MHWLSFVVDLDGIAGNSWEVLADVTGATYINDKFKMIHIVLVIWLLLLLSFANEHWICVLICFLSNQLIVRGNCR